MTSPLPRDWCDGATVAGPAAAQRTDCLIRSPLVSPGFEAVKTVPVNLPLDLEWLKRELLVATNLLLQLCGLKQDPFEAADAFALRPT